MVFVKGMILVFEGLIGIFVLLFFGYYSDILKLKYGRRRFFIMIGGFLVGIVVIMIYIVYVMSVLLIGFVLMLVFFYFLMYFYMV